MVAKKRLEFKQVKKPITNPVTKFGGQPVWLDEAQWPISRKLGEPMGFICQIRISEDLHPKYAGKMVYVFITEDEEIESNKPDTGENAIIIQPGGRIDVDVKPIDQGPMLLKFDYATGEYQDVEYGITEVDDHDPEFISNIHSRYGEIKDADSYIEKVMGTKIGGVPGFVQFDEYPSKTEKWIFVAQIDSTDSHFSIEMGDAGCAFIFVNEDFTIGKMLWQCC